MIRPSSTSVLRFSSLIALSASTAGFLDYIRPSPAFCSTGSACDRIKQLGLGVIGGAPVTLIGMGCFLALFLLASTPSALARRLASLAGMAGGAIAACLIVAQLVLVGGLCKICITVDSAALIGGIAALMMFREGTPEPPRSVLSGLGWFGLLFAALGVPYGIASLTPSNPVPVNVASLWKPGMINVIEFSDFECPFCRAAHPELDAALKDLPAARVNFVRKSLPLAMHPHARDATLGWLCASKQGAGDAMANLLFTQNDLSKQAIEVSAKSLPIDAVAYDACVTDEATVKQMDADAAFIRASDFQGLPTVWINDQFFLGAQPADIYRSALALAARGESKDRNAKPLAMVVAFSLGLVLFGLRFKSDESLAPSRAVDARERRHASCTPAVAGEACPDDRWCSQGNEHR